MAASFCTGISHGQQWFSWLAVAHTNSSISAPHERCAGAVLAQSSSCFSGFRRGRTHLARYTLGAGVLRTGWRAWRSRSLVRCRVLCGADRRRPYHSSVTTGHEPARRRQRAPVDAPRPVSERKPRSHFSRVSALGADHGNRQRSKNVGVEEAHLRPPGGRRWQPPHVTTAVVAFRSGQGHSMGVLARVTLVTAVGGCVTD